MYRMMKRGLDLLGSIMLFSFFVPVILLTALFIRIKLGSPILFRQQRPGRYGRPFIIYKFRTMADLYDETGQLLPDEARISTWGNWIRRWSLDELLQLLNVIKGDMSLIGPRPLLMRYLPYYNERESLRFQVRPGITGLAQISGRNHLSWDDRLELDAQYVETLSFKQDAGILWNTFFKVIKQEDVMENPSLHEPPLDICRSN
jgi:lipopolysaccharide/colanic/teichoic acid biosynthesis glycosyltransferase